MAHTLIVIQGRSGVGKTTLMRRLAADLGIGYIAKDTIKEMLYDTVGYPADQAESRQYGKAAIDAMYLLLAQLLPLRQCLVLESAFNADFAYDDILAATRAVDAKIVQVYVTCDEDERMRRRCARVQDGTRHPGHGDSPDGSFTTPLGEQRAIEGFDTITVDTTTFSSDDYTRLLQALTTRIGESDETTN